MEITYNVTEEMAGGMTVRKRQAYSAAAHTQVLESVATGLTDKEIAFALDVSECVAFLLVSDQDVTFETNSGSAPDDTIALLANVPYIWYEDSYAPFLITADITTNVFITNASGATATVTIMALYDPTP